MSELIRNEAEAIDCLKKNRPSSGFYMLQESVDMAITALEEIQQYRAIGTVSEFRENKNFLEFLYNHIQTNEMEQYLAMYHASREKGE